MFPDIKQQHCCYSKSSHFFSLMLKIVNAINSFVETYDINVSLIITQQICLGMEMKVDGWIIFVLKNEECIVLNFDNGVFLNQGLVLNQERILKVIGNHQNKYNANNMELTEKGIVDLDDGSRFEGSVLNRGKIGIPFGFGEMYDKEGTLLYKGIVINWKRFGYGVSYHSNRLVEYEGYWCNDYPCGFGKYFNRRGKSMEEPTIDNNMKINADDYKGDGSKPINVTIKHLKLSNNCVLREWNVSWFYNLESIEIGDECFNSVITFIIDGLCQLRTIKIGKNSFTKAINGHGNEASKSFHITNCESLESIEIGEYSFSDFAGELELKNLNKLNSIEIGLLGYDSYNFYHVSLKIRGIYVALSVT